MKAEPTMIVYRMHRKSWENLRTPTDTRIRKWRPGHYKHFCGEQINNRTANQRHSRMNWAGFCNQSKFGQCHGIVLRRSLLLLSVARQFTFHRVKDMKYMSEKLWKISKPIKTRENATFFLNILNISFLFSCNFDRPNACDLTLQKYVTNFWDTFTFLKTQKHSRKNSFLQNICFTIQLAIPFYSKRQMTASGACCECIYSKHLFRTSKTIKIILSFV